MKQNLFVTGLVTGCLVLAAALLLMQILVPKLAFFGKPSTYFDTSRAAVIKQIQGLNRLETAAFTIEKIIEAGTQGNAFQEILYGDRILLIAQGQVIAGFDLSKLEEKNITVTNRTLKVQLPEPEILTTSLNSQATRVYDRRLGLLSKGNKDLEAQAREQAELTIKKAACETGILTQAADQGRLQMTALFKGAGFEQVEVIVPQASCD